MLQVDGRRLAIVCNKPQTGHLQSASGAVATYRLKRPISVFIFFSRKSAASAVMAHTHNTELQIQGGPLVDGDRRICVCFIFFISWKLFVQLERTCRGPPDAIFFIPLFILLVFCLRDDILHNIPCAHYTCIGKMAGSTVASVSWLNGKSPSS